MTQTSSRLDAFAPASSSLTSPQSHQSHLTVSTSQTMTSNLASSIHDIFNPSDSVQASPEKSETHIQINAFAQLGLARELIQAVSDLGYVAPTAVQHKVIPAALPIQHSNDNQDQSENQDKNETLRFVDLMVSSQTGSGKTAAFLLPVLNTLIRQQEALAAKERADFERASAEASAKGQAAPKRSKRKDPTNPRHFKAATPHALVLCPTRELAQQVAHDAIGLVKHCKGLRVANIVGGMPYQMQIAKLQNADLVVATPGRLLDLQRSMQVKLDQVQFLVVDEADRMLDLGFADDLAEIHQLTVERKQTMMFSATFASRIQQLASRVMNEPRKIQIDSPQEKHANIKQVLFWADNAQHKRKMLDHWLRDSQIDQAIVFASTQIECDGLASDLQQDGFSAVALHGALSQGLRNRRLMALRQGQVQILVATDVAARGIDVPTITHVFNYGLPMKAEDYTHRIGRTGRAGRDGLAVTFAEMRDRRRIFDIETFNKQPIKAEVIPGLEPQQRMPEQRAKRGDFGGNRSGGGRNERGFGGSRGGFDRDRSERRFDSNKSGGGFGGNGGGFGDRNKTRGESVGFGGRASGFADESRPHFNEEHKPRKSRDHFSPRDDFAARKSGSRPHAFNETSSGRPFVPSNKRSSPRAR